jgi:hypothetical protein
MDSIPSLKSGGDFPGGMDADVGFQVAAEGIVRVPFGAKHIRRDTAAAAIAFARSVLELCKAFCGKLFGCEVKSQKNDGPFRMKFLAFIFLAN